VLHPAEKERIEEGEEGAETTVWLHALKEMEKSKPALECRRGELYSRTHVSKEHRGRMRALKRKQVGKCKKSWSRLNGSGRKKEKESLWGRGNSTRKERNSMSYDQSNGLKKDRGPPRIRNEIIFHEQNIHQKKLTDA